MQRQDPDHARCRKLLEHELKRHGIDVATKESILPAYLREFERDNYLRLLPAEVLKSTLIIYGLRLFEALVRLHEATEVHVVYREPPSEVNLTVRDAYFDGLPYLRDAAEVVLPWQADMSGLFEVAHQLGVAITKR